MTATNQTTNRWLIACAGAVLQLCLGTVYAWSYFQKPLAETYRWSNTQVAWVFSLAICCLGLAAAWGGMNLAKFGPRRLATAGGALFGAGYLVAALALQIHSLPLLYLGYGLLGGIGLGLGYVTPVATAAKWFPDKKGLITGMVIMGFGFGALLMSKILVPALMFVTGGNLAAVFAWVGVAFGIITVLCGWILRNPPADFAPPGSPALKLPVAAASHDQEAAGRDCLLSSRFFMMWAVFFCNIVAGIAIIGFQSPLFQDLLKQTDSALTGGALASAGASLIAASSIFNGLGRFFWGGISDRVGRAQAFRILLGTQIIAFLALARISHPWLFAVLICYVLLCYGGGFGTMPSLVLDVFGGRLMPLVYGAILTAWSAAGIVGPQIVAWLKDHYGPRAATLAFQTSAGFAAAGFMLSLLLSSRAFEKKQKPAAQICSAS